MSCPDYAELVVTSNFTFRTGASHPQELVATAAERGYTALALTDECSLAGVVRAWEEAERCALRGRPIRLIPGSAFRVDEERLVLLPQTERGYGQLCRLITRARRRARKGEYRVEATDFEHGLDDCLALWLPDTGARPTTGHWLAAHFPQRAWLGVTLHLGPDDRRRLADFRALGTQTGMPLVACGDVQMHRRPRRMLHDVLAAIRHQCTLEALGDRALPSGERHLRPRRVLASQFPADLLRESVRVAGRCRFRLDQLQYRYPREVVPEGRTASEHLRQLTIDGLHERWPEGASMRVKRQVIQELRLIRELAYESFFLTVHDLVRFARGRGILCQGRGSAANSAVCYCLGITEVDPSRMNMLFERFISRERNEPPDIDVDFEHERREEVIQYVYRKYGRDRAALAATIISYRPRSAIRDVGKALGFSIDQVDRLARNVSWWDQPEALATRLAEQGFDPAARRVRQLLHLVGELIGFPRHLSQHVGGFVISDTPLAGLVPVENAAMPDRTVIQWDKDDLETLGLLKVDCLALGMLTAIHRCLDLVNDFYGTGFDLANIPPEDEATYRMIQQADTVGVFQIESRAQMAMLPRLKPACFYDLVIEVAIVRPGPIQGDMVHPYLQRRRGLEPVIYPSEALRAVLERTLGVPIFQEQVMQVAMVAAGFSGSEADQLRRSMAAWARRGGMGHMRDRLIGGMLERGYSRRFAEQVFQQIRGFGEYGFPESHAASFALLVYVSCWLKCHYPAAFTTALLNAQPMGFYAPSQLVQDARRHGIEVRPVDVRYSQWDHTLEPGRNGQAVIRLGLRLVRGLRRTTVERLETQRQRHPFEHLQDFQDRVRPDAGERRALAEGGALRGLAGHRHRAVWSVAALDVGQRDLLQGAPIDDDRVALRPPAERDDLLADHARLGLSLERHPLALLRPRLRQRRAVTAEELARLPHGRRTRACGLVTLRQRPSTASGTVFITLEDETGMVNVVIWPRVWERQRATFLHGRVLAVDGVVETDGAVRHLIADRVHDYGDLAPELTVRSRDFS